MLGQTVPVRISVSKVAAIAGLHPFLEEEELHDLVVASVYQSKDLLEHDRMTLGLSMLCDDDVTAVALQCLAASEDEAIRALGTSITGVLAERSSTNVMEAVQGLNKQATSLVETACSRGAFSDATAKVLRNAIRTSINTDFGNRQEDAAIKLYERGYTEYPDGNKVCSSQFKHGLSHHKLKDIESRDKAWGLLLNNTKCRGTNEVQRVKEMQKSN